MPQFEFHISRQSRDRYRFAETLFAISGNVIFADFHAARIFAQKMNQQRDLVRHPEQVVKAGQINAMGLIDELLHLLARQYRMQVNPQALELALIWLEDQLGKQEIDKALRHFSDQFPPLAVYRGQSNIDEYLEGRTDGLPNRQIALEEMLLLWLANANPAFSPFKELFDDQLLGKQTAYPQIIKELDKFFKTQPPFGPENQTLFEILRAPALASPHSLDGQIDFLRQRWLPILGDFLQRLLRSVDLIKEEEKPGFFGPGPAKVPEYTPDELVEEERYSPDSDWMPKLVLIAKNAYVWLDQLSKQYHRQITRLDQVPDEELDKLSRWGFSGLWLIGLWERSPASQRIKQLCGNPDAVSSAYSLYDYEIAADLGGDDAYQNLRKRAWQLGIRLAADMVPNHVGIYSKWVIEHPDWFISLDHSPFPTYTYNGENLSQDERVGIYLEDHYYSRSDAAVVFKRHDTWTGDEKYIYHGNDGTAMPWNDTAQLDYLNPEVREAVIQTILHVARKFPIIRFDAAMTLAKKHFQRLWFPEPGSGGDIPSRAEYGLGKDQFNQAIPLEFWREVVDRVAEEIPDTLLLAEAFWMMEGYFVRTLGMHRVYNSAFMNMLRDEKNAEYRQLIKNTLEFDPQILKRYVNFMNNPDEDTAIDQFGADDKYFGICTLMATLPGLPMFGHGQTEGYHEKYGMEYRRAYWDEYPDNRLVNRHEGEIFPLFHQRAQFAEVDQFRLYDFYTADGRVDENVFAYSNRLNGRASLVFYHNRWGDTRGWVKTSANFRDKDTDQLQRSDLAFSLGLENQEQRYTLFRDHISGLEFIRNNTDLYNRGLYVELGAYKYHVFVDFEEISDNEWGHYAYLNQYLDGRGVANLEDAIKEIVLQPLHFPFRELVNPEMFQWLSQHTRPSKTHNTQALSDEVEQKTLRLLNQIGEMLEIETGFEQFSQEICLKLEAILQLQQFKLPFKKTEDQQTFKDWLHTSQDEILLYGALFGWLFSHSLAKIADPMDYASRSRSWLDEWMFGKIIEETLIEMELDEGQAQEGLLAVRALISQQAWALKSKKAPKILTSWLRDEDIQRLLGVNRYQGILWFNKEAYERLLRWMLAIAVVTTLTNETLTNKQKDKAVQTQWVLIQKLEQAALASEYQVEKLIQAAKE
jgi:glycosidase